MEHTFPNIDRNLPPPSDPVTRQSNIYFKDIAGNNVMINMDYIATMKTRLNMTATEMETLIKFGRPPSPCPCNNNECNEQYKKDKEAYETLLTAKAKGEK